jgi:hypothetical protein
MSVRDPSSNEQKHIYTMSPPIWRRAWFYWFILGWWALVWATGIIGYILWRKGMITGTLGILEKSFFVVFLALLPVALIYTGMISKIVVSPWGISYISAGIRIQCPWSNVQSIEAMPLGRSSRLMEVLVLRESALIKSAIRNKEIAEKEGKYIPIEAMVNGWRNTPLAADIRRYAKQLFSK